MRWESTVTIEASADRVWQLNVDVANWPAITPKTMQRVERLDDGPLRLGSSARIKQPGQTSAVWTVTRIEEGREFAWQTKRIGMTMTGTHRLADLGSQCRNTLILEVTGPGSGIFGRVVGPLLHKTISTENACFKNEAEQAQRRSMAGSTPDPAADGYPTAAKWLIRDVIDVIVRLGLVSAETVAQVVPREVLGEPVDYYGKPDGMAVAALLVDLGAGVAVPTCDGDDLAEDYAAVLQDIAACTDGRFAITDVTVTPPYSVSGRSLHFRRNGTPVEWEMTDFGEDYLDVMVFIERIHEFTDSTDARRWAHVDMSGDQQPYYFLFGHPSALRRLAEIFKFTICIETLATD